ncbi:MAG: ATP-binding protein [Bacteroidales bacterium]|nr:ATP-binding protein [Bacteroidales bacterium]
MKDLSLHILDIAQNSIVAGASLIQINIEENTKDNTLTISITDNGKGMSEETLKKVTDPYYTSRTTRKVGLGIPLFKQNAEKCGGHFSIQSTEGKGTITEAVFEHNHIDRPPIGDIAGVVIILVSANPELDFIYSHNINEKNYTFDTREIKEILEGIPLNEPEVVKMLRGMIKDNLSELKTK